MPENAGNTEPHDRRNHLAKREDHITWQLEKYGQMYAELETRLKDLELQRLKDPGPSNDEARDFVIEQMGKALEGQRSATLRNALGRFSQLRSFNLPLFTLLPRRFVLGN